MIRKDRKGFYLEITIWIILIIAMTEMTIEIYLEPEQVVIDRYLNMDTYGDAKTRSKIVLYKFLVSHWGKDGMIGLGIFIILIFLFALWNTISRFQKRLYFEKLVHEGLASQYDNLDDYYRKSLWQKIWSFFVKNRNKTNSKKNYPSEREMRKSLKNNKYYKE